ncbi:hypothetical protein AC1031_017068 [Aphanomyces cochlioides]|nr:hypothetical protein AC1031_017068 [Aphanomyces cochlioides]
MKKCSLHVVLHDEGESSLEHAAENSHGLQCTTNNAVKRVHANGKTCHREVWVWVLTSSQHPQQKLLLDMGSRSKASWDRKLFIRTGVLPKPLRPHWMPAS